MWGTAPHQRVRNPVLFLMGASPPRHSHPTWGELLRHSGATLSRGDDLRDIWGDASVYETEPRDEQHCLEATSWQSLQGRTRQVEVGLFYSTHGCLSSWKETGRWLSFCLQTLPEVTAVFRSFLEESEKSSTGDQLPPVRCCLCCPAPRSPRPRRAAAAQYEALPWWLFGSAARKGDVPIGDPKNI